MATLKKEKESEINQSKYPHIQQELLRSQNKDPKVVVCVRKKPIDNTKDIILVETNSITVQNNKLSYSLDDMLYCHKFQFDKAYGDKFTNVEIFKDSIEKLVDHTLEGGCSTIVAYGQTGTGKTYSLLSPYSGVIFEAIRYILRRGFKGSISFLEIYLGSVQDCLKNKTKINIFEKEGSIYASELTCKHFDTFEQAVQLISDGLKNRTTSPTDTNSHSSRSHAVLFIDCYRERPSQIIEGVRKLASNSSFILIDLAGSERGTDRKNCSRESAAEGAEINKSLLALKECIRGIEMNSKFLPFRQSKLTQLLKNSFIGESKLLFLATISASAKDVEHTLNTLRYAIRIKESKFYSLDNCENENKISDEEKIIGEQITVEKISKESQRSLEKSELQNSPKIEKFKPTEEINDKQIHQNSFSILTSDEISRLKDLNLNYPIVSGEPITISIEKSKIKKYVDEINRLVEMKKDSGVFKEISKDLESVIFRLNNIKNL